jgi:acyl-CoA thioesterase
VTEPALERMISIFDVEPLDSGPARFSGGSDGGGGRQVVDGSQILAQSLVAASKALPGRTVRCAHIVFVSAARAAGQLEFTVTPVRAGRLFATAAVSVRQGGRTCAACTVLLDYPQPDVIRHDRWTGPPSAGPEAACPAEMPMRGRQLRIEDVRDHGSPDETGPPELDAWLLTTLCPGAMTCAARWWRISPGICRSPRRCGHTKGSARPRRITRSRPR